MTSTIPYASPINASDRPMVSVRDVRVDYQNLTAVRDVALDIAPGEIVGLIGPNGAGKTSLMRVLASLQEPTYGLVNIGGIDALHHPEQCRPLIGYMPDMPMVPEDLTCREYLDMFAAAYGLRGQPGRQRVSECLAAVDLTDRADTMAGTLSLGLRQRLVLAKTILHQPAFLILDEPAGGLDPHARIRLRDTLRSLARTRCAILISSHILSELSDICTSVCIMAQGRIIRQGKIDELIRGEDGSRTLAVRLLDEDFDLPELLGKRPEVRSVIKNATGWQVVLEGRDADIADLLRFMVEMSCPVIGFMEHTLGVEDIFIQANAQQGKGRP